MPNAAFEWIGMGGIPVNNNFTSICAKVKAVVDYIVALHEYLKRCVDLTIYSPNEYIESGRFSCLNLLGDRCRLPEQSTLVLTFQAGCCSAADYMDSDHVQLKQDPQVNI